MSRQYNLVSDESGAQSISIYLDEYDLVQIADDHPNFDKIKNILLGKILCSDRTIASLCEPINIVSDRLEQLSERISLRGNNIFFDEDAIDNSVAKHIVRLIQTETEDWNPLVLFLEKIATNPNKNSREQLYNWLDGHDFTINHEGNIVGYKGVTPTQQHGVYKSVNAGKAFVNGVEKNGQIHQTIGDVVTIPRSEVDDNPSRGCSVGLHVGTHNYAKGWADQVLQVEVNPRDVVSVPNDSSFAKLRTSRYKVLALCEDQIPEPIVKDSYYWDEGPKYPDYDYDYDPHGDYGDDPGW